MYIKNITVKNYGSISELRIVPEFGEDGSPKPVVIVGKNGSGKTLLLSHIVDGMIELKKKKYATLIEVKQNSYFRMGQKSYIKVGNTHSLVRISYANDGKEFFYIDLMTHALETTKQQIQNTPDGRSINWSHEVLENAGYYKEISGSQVGDELDNSLLLYFPVHRYYTPSWYNQENGEVGFNIEHNVYGKSRKSIIKEDVLKEIEQWILGVVLDEYIYEQIQKPVVIFDQANGALRQGTEVTKTRGKNTILHELLNEILSVIYRFRYPNIQRARLGISQKGDRRISIILMQENGEETEIAPTFAHLSSGEAMLICLFGTLLKEYDELNATIVRSLNDVKGIVLIDEIDLNFHIEFAKEILPRLLSKFPNVQFIFTTHSPFLLLGMEQHYSGQWQLLNMPDGTPIAVDNFSEVQDAYDIFTNGYSHLKHNYNKIQDMLGSVTKTLIITEGKTDWKHLKNALNFFRSQERYSDLNLEFLEYEDDIQMSDSELFTLLKNLSKLPHPKCIIGIFDRDEGNGRKFSKAEYTNLGNNVFAMSIPNPKHRSNHDGISIEFLYTDNDLMRQDEYGRRIYLSSEFSEKTGRHKQHLHIGLSNATKIKGKGDVNSSKIIDSDVYDSDEESLALSKNDFAQHVYDHDHGFENMDLSGFENVFNVLETILTNSNDLNSVNEQVLSN